MLRVVGRGIEGGGESLTLTGADDECDLRQPKESTNSRESQCPAVKVFIFKAVERPVH